MRLYLVRHGQTQWNVDGRAQGHSDIPLDSHGEEQVRRLALAFEGMAIERVITSDLQRSAKTAEAMAEAACAKLVLEPLLRERSFGQWEGLPYERIWDHVAAAQNEGLPREQVTPPGGESIAMVWHRLESVCQTLQVLQGPTAVVTHGGTCALLLAQLVRGTSETARSFRFSNTGVTELHLRPGGYFIVAKYNDTAHLDDLPAKVGNLEGVGR